MSATVHSAVLAAIVAVTCNVDSPQARDRLQQSAATRIATIDPTRDRGAWEGWGSSLAWWGRAVGGTGNADYYADLIYTMKTVDGYPGLGLNIVRYNVGGGGTQQPQENKGPKLQWQMDLHGYWIDPSSDDPNGPGWDWSLDVSQRTMMSKAQQRGANLFEAFSDSPMWWMNFNKSTAGSNDGGNCLAPTNNARFAHYMAMVARYAADHWGITFTSVEPFNEPSANWWTYPARQEGCHFERSTQPIIITNLRSALDRVNLQDVAVASSDENDIDAALATWNSFDPSTRAAVGKVNVHGYFNGTDAYRGRNRRALHEAAHGKRIWQSEYGENDATGFTLANSIILDVRDLQPSAWAYWQPVEPGDNGWGLILANYVDTGDRLTPDAKTQLVRVNRKFFVYGQFTRYLRPGYHIINIDHQNSIAAYDVTSRKLVIVTVSDATEERVTYDLSRFTKIGSMVQRIVTTTAPGNDAPDWRQHVDTLSLDRAAPNRFTSILYPKAIYTFVLSDVVP
jgi:galactan endo-1,6-beta-galactosidase